MRTTNKGRSASEGQREQAAELVRLYRQAKESKTGRACVNPNDDPEDWVYVEYSNVEYLLEVLDDFSKTGKFGSPYENLAKRLMVRLAIDQRVAHGKSKLQALLDVAEEYSVDKRTIERWISKT